VSIPRELKPHKRFYEKLIKVKAVVAALLNLFSDVSHKYPMVTCGSVKGAAEGRRSSHWNSFEIMKLSHR
jgi:hypothetical protein